MNAPRPLVLILAGAVTAGAARAGDRFAVKVVGDVAYHDAADADPAKHKLDLYLPEGRKDFPVLFFVHGGTWKSGDRKVYKPVGELFASHGLGTVVISYRLSPKVLHPAHVEDVARAFAWTCANIARYGGRADRVFACGHSAGGHLVALLATDESYLKGVSCSLADLRGVIPISGVYRIVPLGAIARAFGTDLKVCNKASPVNNVNGKHPPFLLLYADRDLPTLGAMAEEMGRALRNSDCDARVVKVEDRDHVTIMTRLLKDDDPTRRAVLDFVSARSAGP